MCCDASETPALQLAKLSPGLQLSFPLVSWLTAAVQIMQNILIRAQVLTGPSTGAADISVTLCPFRATRGAAVVSSTEQSLVTEGLVIY